MIKKLVNNFGVIFLYAIVLTLILAWSIAQTRRYNALALLKARPQQFTTKPDVEFSTNTFEMAYKVTNAVILRLKSMELIIVGAEHLQALTNQYRTNWSIGEIEFWKEKETSTK